MNRQKQTNNLTNLVGLILILLAIGITFMSKSIDVYTITAPFEAVMETSISGTYLGDKVIERIHQYEAAREAEKLAKELDIDEKEIENPITEFSKHLSEIPELTKAQEMYIKFQAFVEKLENSIAEIDNYFVIVVALLLLFTIKSIVALIPVSATCLVTAIIFPFRTALLINFAGYALIFTSKYFWGKYIGEGNISKLMKHSEFLWKFIQNEENGYATGNPSTLFVLRLVPTVPLNPISQMYGKMGYNYPKYLLLSLLGTSLKIISFTAIGSNVGDPFSKAFVVPLITILFVSGFSILAFSIVLYYRNKDENKKMMV